MIISCLTSWRFMPFRSKVDASECMTIGCQMVYFMKTLKTYKEGRRRRRKENERRMIAIVMGDDLWPKLYFAGTYLNIRCKCGEVAWFSTVDCQSSMMERVLILTRWCLLVSMTNFGVLVGNSDARSIGKSANRQCQTVPLAVSNKTL